MSWVECVAGRSRFQHELRSRTQVQKAVQVMRRMGRSLVEFSLAASPQKVSQAHPLPTAMQAMSWVIILILWISCAILFY